MKTLELTPEVTILLGFVIARASMGTQDPREREMIERLYGMVMVKVMER